MIKKINLDYKEYLKNDNSDCLILDPPWNFDNKSPKITATTQFTKWQDDKKDLEEIFKLSNSQIIFCWTPASYIPIFFEIDLHGYKYKTILSWVKLTKNKDIFKGMGFWFKNSCEYLLMFTKNGAKPLHSNIDTIIFEEVTKSSQTQKPKKFESRLLNNLYDSNYKKITYIFSGIFVNYDIPPGLELNLVDINFFNQR